MKIWRLRIATHLSRWFFTRRKRERGWETQSREMGEESREHTRKSHKKAQNTLSLSTRQIEIQLDHKRIVIYLLCTIRQISVWLGLIESRRRLSVSLRRERKGLDHFPHSSSLYEGLSKWEWKIQEKAKIQDQSSIKYLRLLSLLRRCRRRAVQSGATTLDENKFSGENKI